MNKGISFYWGYVQKPEESAKMLKDIGFDCVITSASNKYKFQNGSLSKQIKLFKKYNLKLSSLHTRYDKNSKFLWVKGFKGYIVYKKLLNDIKKTKKCGSNVAVVHLYGEPSEVGYKRLKKILNVCKKLDVYFAVENISKRLCFEGVFKNITHSHLKFCYDIGHNNCFDPDYDYLEKYGDKLICLHLHDNMGEKDDHTLNKYGNINWNAFAKKLKKINYTGNLDYELLLNVRNNETIYQAANEAYKQAIDLEIKINNN